MLLIENILPDAFLKSGKGYKKANSPMQANKTFVLFVMVIKNKIDRIPETTMLIFVNT